MEDESELKGEDANDVSTDVSSTKRIKPQYNYKYGHIAVKKSNFKLFRELRGNDDKDDAFLVKLLECWQKYKEQMS